MKVLLRTEINEETRGLGAGSVGIQVTGLEVGLRLKERAER